METCAAGVSDGALLTHCLPVQSAHSTVDLGVALCCAEHVHWYSVQE